MIAKLRNKHSLFAVVLVLMLVAVAACSDDDNGSGDSGDGGGDLSGEVVISGSSTVEPVSATVAEKFNTDEAPNVAISVDGPGTGDGFQLFCNGETDISDASRAIDEEEIASCEESGVEYVELKIGIDGLSVITSANNDAVECLNFGDLYALLGPESEGFSNWSDADELALEVGGDDEFPDAPLEITAPGEESGTYDSFVEIVLEGTIEEQLGEDADAATRPDYTSSPDDNTIIEGVAGSDTSLGWVGFAFANENTDRVKLLEVDGGDGCVAPTPDTIADNSFPISRPLFIYVNTAEAEENAAVAAYVDYYMAQLTESVEEVGYIPLTTAEQDQTRAAWEAAIGGSGGASDSTETTAAE